MAMSLLPVDAEARAAVEKARKYLPHWQKLARIVARNPKLKVNLHPTMSYTDGEQVFVQIPPAFRRELIHDRTVCNKRSDRLIQQCEACKVLEFSDGLVYHEVAHISMGSFQKVDRSTFKFIRDALLASVPDDDMRDKMKASMEKHEAQFESLYPIVASAHPYSGIILNIVEDARVNEGMCEVRPGVRKILTAMYNQEVDDGIETLDGKHYFFGQTPLNAQMGMITLLAMSDIEVEGVFSDKVWEDFQDEELQELVQEGRETGSVYDSAYLTFKLLTVYNRLGYFLVEQDEEQESDDDSSGDSSEDSSPGGDIPSDDDQPGTDDPDPESGDGSAEAGDDEDDYGTSDEVKEIILIASGHGNELDGYEPKEDNPFDQLDVEVVDAGTPEARAVTEAVERAINQIDFFDMPSLNVSGVKIIHRGTPEGAWEDRSNWPSDPVDPSLIGPALNKLRLVFTENRRRRQERNLKSGKIDTRTLGKRGAIGDPRVFKKRILPGKRDYFVTIGLDVSGSTANGRIRLLRQAAEAQATMLHKLGVPFAVYAHSGDYAQLVIMEVKAPHEAWGSEQIQALRNLCPYSGNLDGHTLEYYRKVTQRSSAESKLILYYTDGAMPAANYNEELEILQREIKICQKIGIHLVGVGVGTDSPTEHGLDTIQINSIDDLRLVVDGLGKRLGG